MVVNNYTIIIGGFVLALLIIMGVFIYEQYKNPIKSEKLKPIFILHRRQVLDNSTGDYHTPTYAQMIKSFDLKLGEYIIDRGFYEVDIEKKDKERIVHLWPPEDGNYSRAKAAVLNSYYEI